MGGVIYLNPCGWCYPFEPLWVVLSIGTLVGGVTQLKRPLHKSEDAVLHFMLIYALSCHLLQELQEEIFKVYEEKKVR